MLTEFLDESEDVIPASAVQTGGVLAKLPKNLVHLEHGQDGFNENGRLDRATLNSQEILGFAEDLVPQARFEMVLQLGEIEVWAASPASELMRIVEEENRKIE